MRKEIFRNTICVCCGCCSSVRREVRGDETMLEFYRWNSKFPARLGECHGESAVSASDKYCFWFNLFKDVVEEVFDVDEDSDEVVDVVGEFVFVNRGTGADISDDILEDIFRF